MKTFKPGTMHTAFTQTFFHGTRADLKLGDLIKVGLNSNYGQQKEARYIYLSATLDAAVWGAELALGDRKERIYLVEPTGSIEDDPNLTDKKFKGNPTKSYRSKHPFSGWRGYHLAKPSKRAGCGNENSVGCFKGKGNRCY